jgi:hypothetical protein
MWTPRKRIGGLALVGLATLALTVPAHAQFFRRPFPQQGTLPVYSSGVNPNSPFYNPINPLYRVAPGVTSQQALFNTFQPLWAASRLPPWMFGYNPYPPLIAGGYYGGGGIPYSPPIVNPYGGIGYGGIVNPYIGGGYGAAPAVPNPYLIGSVASNPYVGAVAATDSGTNPYVPSYSTDPFSGYLFGTASVMGASGKLMMDQERARIMRDLWEQAHMETRKKRLETERWLLEHRITLSERQKLAQKALIARIQEHATPGEIESGKAQNILLADLAKHPDKKSSLGDVMIDGDILKHINITGRKGGNLGLLRAGDGQLQWPPALAALVPDQERTQIDSLAKNLYELATTEGTVKPSMVNDLKTHVQELQESLSKKINDLPSGQFLEARRFFNELQDVVQGLSQPNLGKKYAEWLRESRKGMTAKEVADWLNSRGLQIAPAMPGDEDAYQVLHQALANYDIAVGTLASNRSE